MGSGLVLEGRLKEVEGLYSNPGTPRAENELEYYRHYI